MMMMTKCKIFQVCKFKQTISSKTKENESQIVSYAVADENVKQVKLNIIKIKLNTTKIINQSINHLFVWTQT